MRGRKNITNLLLRDRQTERVKETQRQRETERGTETQRARDRQTDRQTETERETRKRNVLSFDMKESRDGFVRKGTGRMDMLVFFFFFFFFFFTFIHGKIDTFVAVEIDSQLKVPSRFCDWRSKCCRCKMNGFG